MKINSFKIPYKDSHLERVIFKTNMDIKAFRTSYFQNKYLYINEGFDTFLRHVILEEWRFDGA